MDQADRLRGLSSTRSGVGKTLAITSGKGGVGKTHLATNLSLVLKRRGLRVLLIDADLGLANTNILMGTQVKHTLDDVLFGDCAVEKIITPTVWGVDLIPSSSGIAKMADLDSFTQRTLLDHLASVYDRYDYVLFDTAPGLGRHVLNFNSEAQENIVIAQPELTAITDAYALIKVLSESRHIKKFRLVVNRAPSVQEAFDAYRRLMEVAGEFLNISVDYLGSVPEDSHVTRAGRSQRPVVADAPRSSFALAMERIADKLLATAGGAGVGIMKGSGRDLRLVQGGRSS